MRKLLTLAVLAMAMGIAQMSYSATLVDVPDGHWAADAVQKLVDLQIVQGYPDGTFKGDRPMTRYEYAMVVERMLDLINDTYCEKDDCKMGPKPASPEVTKADLEEIKSIVKKLAAEFKDELAALKVKVDENSAKIDKLEGDIRATRFGNVIINGGIRQRVDVPSSDLNDANLQTAMNKLYYPNTAAFGAGGVETGYQMYAFLDLTGQAGENVDFVIGLDTTIDEGGVRDTANENEFNIYAAYVNTDFSDSVRELDLLTLRSGYQQYDFGPYGMLVDNSGVDSNAALRLDVAKDVVSLTGIAALNNITGIGLSGMGSNNRDIYSAIRMGLDLPWLDLGVNFLADGYLEEKGWGADAVIPLLKDSPFLKEFRAEYMVVTDMQNGVDPSDLNLNDDSFILGLDIYKNERASFSLSYADIPATVAYSGLDINPFTEYDHSCPVGLDVTPGGANCHSYESDSLFIAGFEGIGIEASYIVLGDVELGAKAVIGNFAGGNHPVSGNDLDGTDYPGFGALSVAKPINDSSKVRLEYMQQGKDDVMLSRVRGELVISF